MRKTNEEKKMRKICDHYAYMTDIKRCKYSKTPQYNYYGQTPLKMLPFHKPLARNKKIGDRIDVVRLLLYQ